MLDNIKWKIIKDFDDYEVSETVYIRRIKYDSFNRKLKILKPKIRKNGYCEVQLWKNKIGKYKLIHRLVLETYKPVCNMNILQVNHKNCIKSDNRLENLEWVTASDNMKHAYKNNLIHNIKGEKHKRSKLKNVDVIVIKNILKYYDKINLRTIGEIFNVSPQSICDIKKGRNWKHIKI